MTDSPRSANRYATIRVDQFVAASPANVWRTITEPALVERWWASGNIQPVIDHEFFLKMPGFGQQPCRVLEVVEPSRFVYTFTANWTLTWTLVAEGRGTRLILEHSGFDLDDTRMITAFERMSSGWRASVLPRLADIAAQL